MYNEFVDLLANKAAAPSEDYYHKVVEPRYNSSSLQKEEWVSLWEKMGGSYAYEYAKTVQIKEFEEGLENLNKYKEKRAKEMCEVLVQEGPQTLAEYVIRMVGNRAYFLACLAAGKLQPEQQENLYKILSAEKTEKK